MTYGKYDSPELSKERNQRNNARIREIVHDPQRNPIQTLNVLDNGVVLAAIDTTRSRKTLRKSLQRFCIEHRVRIKEVDPKVAKAIRLIREHGLDVYNASRQVCNTTELARRIQYEFSKQESGDSGVIR